MGLLFMTFHLNFLAIVVMILMMVSGAGGGAVVRRGYTGVIRVSSSRCIGVEGADSSCRGGYASSRYSGGVAAVCIGCVGFDEWEGVREDDQILLRGFLTGLTYFAQHPRQ